MAGPCAVGLEKVEGLVVGASGEEVFEAAGERALVLLMPRGDLLGDFFESFEMGVGVAIAELVVGDDDDSAFEQGGEVGVEHGGSLGGALMAAMNLLGWKSLSFPEIRAWTSGGGAR